MASPEGSWAPGAVVSRPRMAGYAIGSAGTGIFTTVPGLILLFYLTDVLGVAAATAGAAPAAQQLQRRGHQIVLHRREARERGRIQSVDVLGQREGPPSELVEVITSGVVDV